MTTMLTTITLHPKDMTSEYRSNLLRQAKTTHEGSCTSQNGYILSVTDISRIVNSAISTTSSMPIFEVEIKVTTLKPEVGQVISGTVCMIAPYGVFVLIHEKLKVLLPLASMTKAGYTFEGDSKRFVRVPSKGGKGPSGKGVKISDGSDINISLTNVKFEKKTFICIGAPHE